VVGKTELLALLAREKRAGKAVVFTNGCFDLLHPGHIRLLEEARSLGDVLVVAVNSDASVRGNKGPSRPILPEDERAELLAALEAVDYVVIFDEATPRELIEAVKPDVLVKGADWRANEIVGREEVEGAGGKVVSIPLEAGHSTTEIIARIKKLPEPPGAEAAADAGVKVKERAEKAGQKSSRGAAKKNSGDRSQA
jgi:rfaE bifunctional protein nucleotidyltransferase chain/domain